MEIGKRGEETPVLDSQRGRNVQWKLVDSTLSITKSVICRKKPPRQQQSDCRALSGRSQRMDSAVVGLRVRNERPQRELTVFGSPLALQEAFGWSVGRLRASGVKTVHVLWNRRSRRRHEQNDHRQIWTIRTGFNQTLACWSEGCFEHFWHQRKDYPGVNVKAQRSLGAKRHLICYKKSPFPSAVASVHKLNLLVRETEV